MNSNTLLCNLSFYGLHSISEGIGVMDIRIKHSSQLVVGSTQGAAMVAEDVVSPEAVRVFVAPVHVFHLPRLRQLHVSNVLASLNLGSTILKYVTPRMMSFVEEVVERSGGDGFWMVVEVDVWTVDTEDCVNLSAYGWREMESGDEDADEDEYGNGGDEEDNDDDEVRIEPGLNIGEEDGDGDGDGDDDSDRLTADIGEDGGGEDEEEEDEFFY